MAPAFECRIEKDLDHVVERTFAHKISGEAEHVDVIVASAHFRTEVVIARSSPHTVDFVGCDCHADASATNQDPPIRIAFGNRGRHCRGDIRVVDAVFAVGATVFY